MSHALTDLEAAVLDKLLAGDHPALQVLRTQREYCTVSSREFTGAGFFTKLSVSESAGARPLPGPDVRWGDVVAEIPALKYGAGFLLSVHDGYLSELEGYTFEEPWPAEIESFRLRFADSKRDLTKLPA